MKLLLVTFCFLERLIVTKSLHITGLRKRFRDVVPGICWKYSLTSPKQNKTKSLEQNKQSTVFT